MAISGEISRLLDAMRIKAFDAGILPENCRLIYDTYVNEGQALYQDAISGIQDSHQPRVAFYTTKLLSANAAVSFAPEQDVFPVCFHYGLIANIYTCFNALLSHPAVLPYIGDPANTNCSFTIAKNGLTDFTYDNVAIRDGIPLSMGFPVLNYPKDKDRMLYSRLLSDIAMEFCMYHEWGHIVGGHVQYANKEQHILEMLEVNGDHKSQVAGNINGLLMHHVMEFEADFIASSMLINLPLRLQESNRTKFHAYPATFISQYDMRDAVYFSLLTFFHLMQEVRMVGNKEWKAHYPIPYYRFLTLLHAIGETQKEEEKMLWQDYAFKGAEDFMRASLQLNLAPRLGFAFMAHVFDEDSTKKYIVKLARSMEKLKRHLRDYRLAYRNIS